MDSLKDFKLREVLIETWTVVGEQWKQMFTYALMIWVCSATILAPLSSWILLSLSSNGDVIVGNYSFPSWLMTPQGILYVVIFGSVTLFSLLLQITGLFLIVRRNERQVSLSVWMMLRRNLSVLPGLFWFCLRLLFYLVPVALLVALVPGLLYLGLLREHDINFYLVEQPFEWWLTLGLSAVWALCCLVAILYLIARSIYVLPVWLEGVRPIRAAFLKSWGYTSKIAPQFFKLICSFCLIWALVSACVMGGLFLVATLVLRCCGGSFSMVVALMLTYLILRAFFHGALTFLGTAWFASILSKCYHSRMGESSGTLDQSKRAIRWFRFVYLKVFLLVVGVLFAASVMASSVMLNEKVSIELPLIIAHRTAPVYAPENTLSGLDIVLDDGFADLVEVDVVLTGDGEVVVAHDKDLMKLADDDSILAESDYEDLLAIDIGKKFGPEFEGERLGRLEDFLDRTRDRITLMVEFKYAAGTDLVEKTLEIIRGKMMEDQVVLMSLELEDVREVQLLAPDMKVGYFATLETGDLTELDVDFIGTKDWLSTPEFIKRMKEKKVPIYSWTINDPVRMVELVEAGIDGIITNDPPLAKKVLDKLESLSLEQRFLLKFRPFWKVLKEMGLWESSAKPILASE